MSEYDVELTNDKGFRAIFSTLGCSLKSLEVPNRSGEPVDVVLGYASPQSYLNNQYFLGCVVGRYAGRIANSEFKLAGVRWSLPPNDGGNHLHGGAEGFHLKTWEVVDVSRDRVIFNYTSPHLDQGYPGHLRAEIGYHLSADGDLRIDYTAFCDRPTVVNLSNHSYFNLGGHDSGNIASHEIQINAARYAQLDSELMPTGLLLGVENTPLDLRRPMTIGAGLASAHPQLGLAGGYDHGWELSGDIQTVAACVFCEASGISLQVYTDQPSLQFYAGNSLPNQWEGKGGARYGHRQGLCLETQHWPNSPNIASFPSTELRAGTTFRSTTIYRFGVGREFQ